MLGRSHGNSLSRYPANAKLNKKLTSRVASLNRAAIEVLETRLLLTTYTVTDTSDGDAGSLRAAILASNADTAAPNIIKFYIPTTDPGYFTGSYTIIPQSALPTITQAVDIDATTQPGYAGGPIIILQGSSSYTADGLLIQASGSTVQGLNIDDFTESGIEISGASNVTVDADWTAANGIDGILIDKGAQNNTIGGTTAAARNLFSDNLNDGVEIQGTSTGAQTTGNTVEGNYIGTDQSGATALGAQPVGVDIDDAAQNNTVGGSTAAARNIISGNTDENVFIDGTSSNTGPQTSGNNVEGNYIGTDVTGAVNLGSTYGVLIQDGTINNTVGGSAAGDGNLIAFNSTGVVITDLAAGVNASGNTIQGNSITRNSEYGIYQNNAITNQIGGTTAADANIITLNDVGIALGESEGTIQGNYIGTDAAGDTGMGNIDSGILLTDSERVLIGGTVAGASNVISGNEGDGIMTIGSSYQNLIEGNYVGTNAAGSDTIGNLGNGVELQMDSVQNTIGGTTAAAANVISANNESGVKIDDSSGDDKNSVDGNYIGTNAAGAKLGNSLDGVDIEGSASENIIGGSVPAAGNTIAFNGEAGVAMGNSAANNLIRMNSMYSNTTLGIDLGNDGVSANDPGDGDAGADNTQNFPVLVTALSNGTSTTITGAFNSTASTTFILDFYSNSSTDPDGLLEGKTYVGSATVTTDVSGNATLNATLPTSVAGGTYLTATASTTATSPYGDTSEFAAPVEVFSSGSGGSGGGSSTEMIDVTGSTINPTVDQNFSGGVATFTDTNTTLPIGDFSATINWGDGSPLSAATEIDEPTPGTYIVKGSHTYTTASDYTTAITVTDSSSSLSASGNGTADVGSNLSGATGKTITATEGSAFSGAVATFTDSNTTESLANFSANIDWGDGSASPDVSITQISPGQYQVNGAHTYADFGSYTTTIKITDSSTAASATATGSATIADAKLTAVSHTAKLHVIEGSSTGSVLLGYFTDADPGAVYSDYEGTVSWSDGQTSAATFKAVTSSSSSAKEFAVYGVHTYAEAKDYNVTVNVTDDDGNPANTGGSSVKLTGVVEDVDDAPLTGHSVSGLTAKKGKKFTGEVASFTDGNPLATMSDYTVTINWGDGKTSAGSVAWDSATDDWIVDGTHTYSSKGNYSIVVSIADVGGSKTTATSTIKVST